MSLALGSFFLHSSLCTPSLMLIKYKTHFHIRYNLVTFRKIAIWLQRVYTRGSVMMMRGARRAIGDTYILHTSDVYGFRVLEVHFSQYNSNSKAATTTNCESEKKVRKNRIDTSS